MSQSSDHATLLDIATAARRMMAFIEGMDEAAFRADFKTQSAVQHQLLIMGEAAKRLENASASPHRPPEIRSGL